MSWVKKKPSAIIPILGLWWLLISNDWVRPVEVYLGVVLIKVAVVVE